MEEPRRLLQFDLDAVGQHRDVADLVGLAAEAQFFSREGAKNSTLQQLLRDQATDLLEPFRVRAADTLQFQALGFGLFKAQGARRGVVAQRAAERDRAIDALNFPGVGLDGIGASPWAYCLLCRSIMSHIRGTAQLDNETPGHKINHFDTVAYLAHRDGASYPPDAWRAHYRDIVLNTPDEQPYALP